MLNEAGVVRVLHSFRPTLLHIFKHYAAMDKADKSKTALQTINEVEFQQARAPAPRGRTRAGASRAALLGVAMLPLGRPRRLVGATRTLSSTRAWRASIGERRPRPCNRRSARRHTGERAGAGFWQLLKDAALLDSSLSQKAAAVIFRRY